MKIIFSKIGKKVNFEFTVDKIVLLGFILYLADKAELIIKLTGM